MAARIGGIAAPQVVYLVSDWLLRLDTLCRAKLEGIFFFLIQFSDNYLH